MLRHGCTIPGRKTFEYSLWVEATRIVDCHSEVFGITYYQNTLGERLKPDLSQGDTARNVLSEFGCGSKQLNTLARARTGWLQ